MLTAQQVRAAMLRKLAGSLLDADDAKLLKFKPMTKAPDELPNSKAGFQIPYFDAHGKVTKFYRYRYLEDTRSGFDKQTEKKPLRYGQPAGTVNEIYLPPLNGLDWQAWFENDKPIIVTEGELKAACVTKTGYPTIGLGGVWCFMSKRAGVTLLPQLANINWKRTVYICYDSDAATNPDVVAAESVLADRLTERGAKVMVCRLPPGKGGKQGLDDYLLAGGEMEALFAQAIEYSTCLALHAMSTKVVYVRKPGIVYEYANQHQMTAAAFTQHAFANVLYDVEVDGKLKRRSVAEAWLKWPHRAELRSMVYEPGQELITTEGDLNLWPGWAVQPEEGDVTPWNDLLDHLFGSKKAERQWFERWVAYPLQHPGVKLFSAPVVWGVTHGSGKSLVGYTLMEIYGKNSTEIKDDHLEDARFEWAEKKQFVMGDDITGHDSRRLSRKFMTMITQREIRLNPKYVPSYSVRDCINYYFTSNEPNAFFMDDDDRRFFIHEVLAGKLPVEQRKRYITWLHGKGPAALFHHLLTLDLGDFDPAAEAMQTAAKHEMQYISKSELGAWVADLKENPDAKLNGKMKGDLFTAKELHVLYDPANEKRTTVNALARELTRAGFRYPASGTPLDGKFRAYAIRNTEKWATASWKAACDHYNETHSAKRKL